MYSNVYIYAKKSLFINSFGSNLQVEFIILTHLANFLLGFVLFKPQEIK